MASWLSWLERRPVTAEVEGSSPSGVVDVIDPFEAMTQAISSEMRIFIDGLLFGVLAQLGEHLPYKQRVIGSSPIGPMNDIDCSALWECRAFKIA